MMEDKSRIKILEHSLIDIPASVNASDVIIIEQNDETKVYSTVPSSAVKMENTSMESKVRSSTALDKAKSFYEYVVPMGSAVKKSFHNA